MNKRGAKPRLLGEIIGGNQFSLTLRFGLVFRFFSCTSILFLRLASSAFPVDNADEFYKRGSEFIRVGNLPAALQELEKAAELAPNNPKIHNMLGIVLTQLERLKEANQAYSRALSIAPGFLPARKNRAVNAFTQGDFKFAETEFETLVNQEPRDFVPHLFLGLLAIEARDLPKARRYLLEARQISPYNSQLLLGLTRVNLMLGERQLALGSAREMRTQSHAANAEKFELGVVLAQFEANVEAVEVFQELWQKTPGSYDVGFNLALVQFRVGQLEVALHTVEELISHTKQTGELLNLRGWINAKMRRLDKARESLQQAIAVEPQNADHYLDLSTILKNEGDAEAAIQVVSEGLQQNIERDRLQVQMGLLRQKGGDYTEAAKWFQKALEANPRNRSTYLALANLLSATDRRKEALDLLERATGFLPGEALLFHTYGGLLLDSVQDLRTEESEKAATILTKALELNPFYANTYYLLGKLSLKKGDYESAQCCFEKACAYNPNHAGAYYQLSLIARRQGKNEKAAELGGIFQRLNERLDKSFQESFTDLVGESLRGQGGGKLVSNSKN